MKTKIILTPVIISIFLIYAFTPKLKGSVKLAKTITNEFAFIPAGSIVMDNDTVSVNHFYISKTEVSNQQYKAFLDDLKANNETEKLKIAAIDSNNWMKEFGEGGRAYARFYHSHLAYLNFPVLNISKAGAELYCAWLTKKLNNENEGLNFTVRLPVEAEWLKSCDPSNSGLIYSWTGPYLRNSNGDYLSNFRHFGEGNIYYDSLTKSFQIKTESTAKKPTKKTIYGDVVATVKSYYPSTFGLYNLNGNVAEFTSDGFAMGGSWNSAGYDIRNESKIKTTSSSCEVGFRPVFMVREK